MASTPETPTKIPSAINPRDSEFMFRVVQNMEGNPTVDWDTVAAEMGLKSAGVAKVRFGQIKKKFNFASHSNPAAPTANNDESAVGSGTNVTPTKVRKPRAAPRGTPRAPKTPKTPKKKAAEESEKKEIKMEELPDFEEYEDLQDEDHSIYDHEFVEAERSLDLY